jgi:hypothetical protein
VFAVGLFVAVLALASIKLGSCQDDAFVYFRYARRWVAREGLVFNPGERVEGFTSPLWMLLLTLTTALRLPPVVTSGVLGSLAAAVTVLVSVGDARRSGPPGAFAVLAPVALAAYLPLVLWGVSGLETTLFTCLLWASFARLRAADATGSSPGLGLGLLLGATLLARPEGTLAVAAAGGAVAWRSRSWTAVARVVGPAVACGVLLEAARLAYYGAWLPNTFYVKLGGSAQHYLLGMRYVARFLASAPLVWPAALLAVRGEWRRVPALGASVGLVVLYCAHVVRAGGDYFLYSRFMLPLAPLLFALGAHGVHHGWEVVKLWLRGLRTPRDAFPRRDWAAAVVVLGVVVALELDPVALRPQHGLEWATRWSKLGLTLSALPPGTTLGLPNIGAVGYYSRLPVVDLLGLVDAGLSHQPPTLPRGRLAPNDVGHDRFDVEWSMRRRPTMLIFMHALSSEPFTDISEVPADLWVERDLLDWLGRHGSEYRLMNVPVDAHQYWGVFIRSDQSPARP